MVFSVFDSGSNYRFLHAFTVIPSTTTPAFACIPDHSRTKKFLLCLCAFSHSFLSLVWFLSFWFLFLHYLKFDFETALRPSIFVRIWCFLDFSWFLGLNFRAARTFHFVLISYCHAFWFEFLRFCFCVYISLQSQLFCFNTCMLGVVYACLFVTLFNDRPVGWCFFCMLLAKANKIGFKFSSCLEFPFCGEFVLSCILV